MFFVHFVDEMVYNVYVGNSKERSIKANELVIGDIITVKNGDTIQADCVVIECVDLMMDQSIITGKYSKIRKYSTPFCSDSTGHEHDNIVYDGSLCVGGRAKVIVCEIGNKTLMHYNMSCKHCDKCATIHRLASSILVCITSICVLLSVEYEMLFSYVYWVIVLCGLIIVFLSILLCCLTAIIC